MRITVDQAAKILNEGGNAAIPTETVYGLAAVYDNPEGIENIFKLKGRPKNNPLIIHVGDIKTVELLARFIPESFYAMAEAFWPGPLALALEVHPEKVLESVRAHLPKACFRMPDHPLALEVIRKSGPLVMPSANLSGKPSTTDVLAVEEDLGEDFPVLDGGECVKGLESTILIFEDDRWHLGRLGSLAVEEISQVIGYEPIEKIGSEKPLCPGQKWRHYAPKATLSIAKEPPQGIKAILGFQGRDYPASNDLFYLGKLDDPKEAAAKFYSTLRDLDRQGITEAWIDCDFPETGLWRTLRERIQKAASA